MRKAERVEWRAGAARFVGVASDGPSSGRLFALVA